LFTQADQDVGRRSKLLALHEEIMGALGSRHAALVVTWLDEKQEATMSIKTYRTMTEAIQGLKERGFSSNFEYLNNAFRSVDGGKTFTPDELTIVEHHRFEGASDPDDLSILYGIESQDGTRGILVDAYGAYANPDISAFLKKVKIREDL
jgi:hypothetical protein